MESFHIRLSTELLNLAPFHSLRHARAHVLDWRDVSNAYTTPESRNGPTLNKFSRRCAYSPQTVAPLRQHTDIASATRIELS